MAASRQDVDTVLEKLGNIGPYQIWAYFLSCLPIFIAGAISIALIFTTAVPEYRCHVDGCDTTATDHTSVLVLNNTFLRFTTPQLSEKNQSERCHLYARKQIKLENGNTCVAEEFDNNTRHTCNQYVFEKRYFVNTVVTEFGLVCQYSWLVQILQSSFFVGILLGAICNGIIADKYGRKTVFVFISPMLLVTLFISAISQNAILYCICLVLKGISVAGIYQSAFVIGIEFLGGRWRFWLGNVHSIIFALGAIYACIVADYFRSWRLIELSITVPVILMLSFPCIFPESIRWQLSNGQSKSAVEQIKKAARFNRVTIEPESLSLLVTYRESKHGHNQAGLLDLFTHPTVRVWTLSLLYIWFTNSLVYYGLSFLSSQIDANLYYSVAILSAVEIPGILLTAFLVEQYSRKTTLMAAMLVGGVSCTIAALLPDNCASIKMWLAILGKSNISGSFSLIYIYTVEIFPTVVRISGLGLCSVFSRIGGISAPYLLQLETFGSSFPFLVIGLASILASVASSVLPETQGKRLPDTFEEIETKNNVKYNSTSASSSIFQEEEQVNLLDNEI